MFESVVQIIGPVMVTVLFTIALYVMVHERDVWDFLRGLVGFVMWTFILFLAYKDGMPYLQWTILTGAVIGLTLWITGVYARCTQPKKV